MGFLIPLSYLPSRTISIIPMLSGGSADQTGGDLNEKKALKLRKLQGIRIEWVSLSSKEVKIRI